MQLTRSFWRLYAALWALRVLVLPWLTGIVHPDELHQAPEPLAGIVLSRALARKQQTQRD